MELSNGKQEEEHMKASVEFFRWLWVGFGTPVLEVDEGEQYAVLVSGNPYDALPAQDRWLYFSFEAACSDWGDDRNWGFHGLRLRGFHGLRLRG